MNVRAVLVLVLASSATACRPAAPANERSPELVDARRKTTRVLVEALDQAPDDHVRARVAAAGLAEEPRYLLPAKQAEVLGIVSRLQGLDAASCSNILATSLHESASAFVTGRCGTPLTALHERVREAPETARASIVASTCRIPLPAGIPPGELDPWAVLTSAAVEAELATKDADELRLARELAKLCGTGRRAP